ncbi:hypothetical protein BC830DRAFT_1136932 [Chytriomyces sp. MP71]|nr:hypothetical protein BC830DRAFT_1136932 [Chytriomyces sp. MP71]
MAPTKQAIKRSQTQLLLKLQHRAEGNLEILTELRFFLKEKSRLDEEYGKGLEKLAKTMESRKLRKGPVISSNVGKGAANLFKTKPRDKSTASSGSLADEPEFIMEDGSTLRAIYSTYLAMLVESEKVGRARTRASERAVTEVSEFLKDYVASRTVTLRKTVDFATKYQSELHASYDDFDKTKTAYEQLSKEAILNKKKYDDTARNPNSGLNALKNAVSRMDAEERVEMLKQKWKSTEVLLVKARNDHLLAIASLNAQQQQFYNSDLPTWMEKFDNDFHSIARTVLGTCTDIENEVTGNLSSFTERIQKLSILIDPAADSNMFLHDNSVLFADPKEFVFEPFGTDKITDLLVDDITQNMLGQQLSHLKSQSAELVLHLEKKQAEFNGLKQLNSVNAAAMPFGGAIGTADQLAELQNAMDLIKCTHSRVLVQISLLEHANVAPVTPLEYPSPARTLKQENILQKYVCVYPYTAKVEGELSMRKGDQLTAIAVETDGWILVSSNNSKGLVPFNYLELLQDSGNISQSGALIKVFAAYDYSATCDGELSLVIGDLIEVTSQNTGDGAWWEGQSIRGKGLFPANYVSASSPHVEAKQSSSEAHFQVTALFDYTAADSSELSFMASDVFDIVDSSDSDWWTAVKHGAEGLVPASYVRRL